MEIHCRKLQDRLDTDGVRESRKDRSLHLGMRAWDLVRTSKGTDINAPLPEDVRIMNIPKDYRLPMVGFREPWPVEAEWDDIAAAIHLNAVAHGFWETGRNIGEMIALQHSEITEAYEAQMEGIPFWRLTDGWLMKRGESEVYDVISVPTKPLGEGSELVDIVIRCLDTMHRFTGLASDGSHVTAGHAIALVRARLLNSEPETPTLLDLHRLASLSIEELRRSGLSDSGEMPGTPAAWTFLITQADLVEHTMLRIEREIGGPSATVVARRMIQIKHAYNVNRSRLHGKAF